jgi:hypothetical protein
MEKVAKATLRYLFQEYLKSPSVLYTINIITESYKADASDVSNFLVEKKWIRERWVYQNNLVACRITVGGIEEINPSFIQHKLKQLIDGLVGFGGRRSLMQIFQNKIQEYVIALDIVFELEKLGLVRMIHEGGSIDVELTEAGWKFVDRKGKAFFTMMLAA